MARTQHSSVITALHCDRHNIKNRYTKSCQCYYNHNSLLVSENDQCMPINPFLVMSYDSRVRPAIAYGKDYLWWEGIFKTTEGTLHGPCWGDRVHYWRNYIIQDTVKTSRPLLNSCAKSFEILLNMTFMTFQSQVINNYKVTNVTSFTIRAITRLCRRNKCHTK